MNNPQDEVLEAENPLVLSKTKRDPYYASEWEKGISCSKVGGYPAWIQNAEYPVCQECSKHMKFLGQLDCSDFMQYGAGMYYAFICEGCKIAATHYQQT
ncbi:MAG: DUF1963 domain-containing protein [Clostridiaceae bacterium]|nr:DUF1963 domain-containing protein [Clostridiaceae bacterium]